jgi:NAD dependent epimerase/dehydratase family enzyme
MAKENQMVVQMISSNIQEHQSMLYKLQIEEAMGQSLPPLEELQQMPPEQSQQIMNQIAQMATKATAEVTGRAEALAKAEELQRIDPIIELQKAEIRQKAVASEQKREVEKEKIESQEAIAEMKIAAEREKNVQSSILEADRTYADILNTVREADEKTRTE